MKVAVGCDHAGFVLKEAVLGALDEMKIEHKDLGCFSEEPVDYPDVAGEVGRAVASGEYDRGILMCGTGIGMSIAANKVKSIRAAQCYDAFTAHRSRRHNDAQICCLGAEEGKARVPAILESFLTTEFEGERHQERLDKISKIEQG